MINNLNRKRMLEDLLADDEQKLDLYFFSLEEEEVVYLKSEIKRYKRELALLEEYPAWIKKRSM